jgi:hypothetical protein
VLIGLETYLSCNFVKTQYPQRCRLTLDGSGRRHFGAQATDGRERALARWPIALRPVRGRRRRTCFRLDLESKRHSSVHGTRALGLAHLPKNRHARERLRMRRERRLDSRRQRPPFDRCLDLARGRRTGGR